MLWRRAENSCCALATGKNDTIDVSSKGLERAVAAAQITVDWPARSNGHLVVRHRKVQDTPFTVPRMRSPPAGVHGSPEERASPDINIAARVSGTYYPVPPL